MAETFGFSAKVGADVSGFQKGMQKAEKSLKKFADGITNIGKKGIVGSLANVSLAMGGVVTAFRTATKVVKDVAKAVGECTEAYKQQAIVERSLDTAIKNNPYVTGKALSNLKQFASDMQKISNVGDEQIIKLETQLISLGRTEEETMNIIRVAMDMSASGTMSLDTAITQLNATLNGNIGRLGQQNAELKNLTAEELKSGKAVEILGEKFKGLSEATIDTSKQLQNIKGDFKEAIGEFTLPSSDMWNKFWMGFYEKGIDVVHKLQASLDSSRGEGIYEKLAGSVKKIKNEEEQRRAINDALSMSTEVELNQLQTYLEGLKKRNALQEKTLEQARATLQYRKDAEEAFQRGKALEEQDEARRQAELDAQKEKEDEIVKLKEEYLKKVAEQEAKWQNIKTITGEEVKAEEKIKFYQDSLVDLMTQAGGQITANNQLYKDQIAIIQKLQAELKPEEKATSNEWEKKLREQLIARLEADKEEKLAEVENSKMASWQKEQVEVNYNEQLKALKLEALEIEKQEALKSVKDLANAEEERLRIQEYYENEKFNLILEYAKKNKNAGAVASESFAKGFKTVIKKLQPIAKEIGQIFKSVASGIETVLKNIGGLFRNSISAIKGILFLDIDDGLIKILEFEDRVLSFFMETLPKLPSYVASVLQSISVLLENLIQNVNASQIADIVSDMVQNLISQLPDIIQKLSTIGRAILSGLANGVLENLPEILKVGSDVITDLINGLIQALPRVFSTLTEIQKQIVPKINELVGNLIKFLSETLVQSIPMVIQSLFDFVAILLKNIPAIIKGIIEAIPVLITSILEAIPKFFIEDFPTILAEFLKLVPTLIKVTIQISLEIIKRLPEIVVSIVQGLVKAFMEIDWWQLVVDIFTGFINGVKGFFGIHSPSTVFAEIGDNILQGMLNGLKDIGEKLLELFKNALDGIKKLFANIGEWASGVWGNIKAGFSNVGEWFSSTFSDAFTRMKNAFSGAKDWFKNLFTNIFDNAKSISSKAVDKIADTAKKIGGGAKNVAEKVWDGVTNVASTVGSAVATGAKAVGNVASKIGSAIGKGLSKLKFWETGVNVAPKGLAVVGEAGPELVRFKGGEQVLNTRNTQKAIAGMNGNTNNFNVTFNNLQDTSAYAMMSQLRAYNRQMAINGII